MQAPSNYQAIVSKHDIIIIIVTNDQFAYTVPVPTVRWPVDDSARNIIINYHCDL